MPRPFDANLPIAPRRRRSALLLSIAVHALIVATLVWHGDRLRERLPAPGARLPFGIGGGGGGGRGGEGNRVAYITLPPAAPEQAAPVMSPPVRTRPKAVAKPVAKPPEAVPPTISKPEQSPTAIAPDSAPHPVDTAATDTAPAVAAIGTAPAGGGGAPGAGPGTDGGSGTGQGPGRGSGRGPGAGPGTRGGGEGGVGAAPEPRQLVLPPDDVPRELRGHALQVTFWVGASGRVERVAVAPPIGNGKFARKFEDTMRNYRFRPARSPAGSAVAGSTTLTVAFY